VILSSLVLLIATFLGIDFFIKLFLGTKFHEVGFLVKIGAAAAILHGFGDFTNKFLSAKGKSSYIKKVAMTVGIVQLVFSLFLIKWLSGTGAMIARSIGSIVYFSCLYFYYHKNYVAVKA
jgi:O-antigen/teichoic acid export membrane protein